MRIFIFTLNMLLNSDLVQNINPLKEFCEDNSFITGSGHDATIKINTYGYIIHL